MQEHNTASPQYDIQQWLQHFHSKCQTNLLRHLIIYTSGLWEHVLAKTMKIIYFCVFVLKIFEILNLSIEKRLDQDVHVSNTARQNKAVVNSLYKAYINQAI